MKQMFMCVMLVLTMMAVTACIQEVDPEQGMLDVNCSQTFEAVADGDLVWVLDDDIAGYGSEYTFRADDTGSEHVLELKESRAMFNEVRKWKITVVEGCKDEPVVEPVVQTVTPYFNAVGIGVSDLEAAVDFYTNVIGMKERLRLSPSYAEEVIMAFEDEADPDHRATLVLMHYNTEKNYTDNPAKLVYAVPDGTAFFEAIVNGGGRPLFPPTPQEQFQGASVGMAFDPDGYMIEIVEVPSLKQPFLSAAGIGVSDLEAAKDYYIRVLGMEYGSDIDVPGYMDEIVLNSPGKDMPSVVLMHWDTERNYKDVPVKLVLNVDSAAEFAGVVAENDPGKIVFPPQPLDDFFGATIGFAKDIDGYLIEILQAAEGPREMLDE